MSAFTTSLQSAIDSAPCFHAQTCSGKRTLTGLDYGVNFKPKLITHEVECGQAYDVVLVNWKPVVFLIGDCLDQDVVYRNRRLDLMQSVLEAKGFDCHAYDKYKGLPKWEPDDNKLRQVAYLGNHPSKWNYYIECDYEHIINMWRGNDECADLIRSYDAKMNCVPLCLRDLYDANHAYLAKNEFLSYRWSDYFLTVQDLNKMEAKFRKTLNFKIKNQ